MGNAILQAARDAKNDEFYTGYADIEKELNKYAKYFKGKVIYCNCDDHAGIGLGTPKSNFLKYFADNFEAFGIKRVIATHYERDGASTMYILDKDNTGDGIICSEDIEEIPLKSNGDFRSPECIELLKQADIVVTNPPFSLFREFVAWLMEGGKQFIIIGNMNAITYKEIFPLIKNNLLWLGESNFYEDMVFGVPEGASVKPSDKAKAEKMGYVGNYTRMGNSCWFTNIDHGRRHQPLRLMTMKEVFKHSKHREIREKRKFECYENFDAIDIPYIDAIPIDYTGVMGVPITFLNKYCPEQFEIVWRGGDIEWCENICDFYTPPSVEKAKTYRERDKTWRIQNPYVVDEAGNANVVYQRILIRKKQQQ